MSNVYVYHKGSNDRHKHNHKKMIEHFMIMNISVLVIMSLWKYQLFPLDHKAWYSLVT